MLEFFLERFELDEEGWNLIFYTGKAALPPALDELNPNVMIVKERPDLHTIIPKLIHAIESGEGLPELYMTIKEESVTYKILEVLEDGKKSAPTKLKEMHEVVHREGLSLTEIGNRMGGAEILPNAAGGETDDSTWLNDIETITRRRSSTSKGETRRQSLGLIDMPRPIAEEDVKLSVSAFNSIFEKDDKIERAEEFLSNMQPAALATW
eukprot:scaffold344771_cov44-Prasinocladus_malaysianus.AAC.1